ncbi:DUF349 domain-containing protein [Persicobacter diffluens]|uniref:DUF349 domain-containing protein n=1 Tax=Persicobacter diffluens TaxID=981 RepID=A0AAN4VWL8_9BACT|nr:hypothetical protein PEDI_13240 [Persicobacter diffluens]
MENDKLFDQSSEAEKENVQPEQEVNTAEEVKEESLTVNEEDFVGKSKEELVKALSDLKESQNFRYNDEVLKIVGPIFNGLRHEERQSALEKYKADGGEPDGFEYHGSEVDRKFDELYSLLKERKHKYYANLESSRKENTAKKKLLLRQLREIVKGEETEQSIEAVRKIQEEWKGIGQVNMAENQELWANYKALLDQYYDRRGIFFELKDLDRRKNLTKKVQLCEKAEELKDAEILDAVRILNELHEEYKNIGPVPREEQDKIWDRFKAASDAVYDRRKEYSDQIRVEQEANLETKKALIAKIRPFVDFNSGRITEWNQETKKLQDLQKEWDAIGHVPRENAKDINKEFWGLFKTFFNNKGQFFKNLEEERTVNLKLKQALVEKAEALKDSEDIEGTANTLKSLQQEWRKIGPVPEKFKDSVFEEFKAACDHFFNRKRQKNEAVEQEFVANFEKKAALCKQLVALAAEKPNSLEPLQEIQAQFEEIGFVPRKEIKTIQQKWAEANATYLEAVEGIAEGEKQRLVLQAKYQRLKSSPNKSSLNKAEQDLRRQIQELEDEINTWKSNLGFFARSKNAEALKAEYDQKIEEAEAKVKVLRDELRILNQA